MKERISIPAKNTNIEPKERERSGPHPAGRHEKFQFGTNPMAMTPFEKSVVMQEREDRRNARHKYIAGLQGTDGGSFKDEPVPYHPCDTINPY